MHHLMRGNVVPVCWYEQVPVVPVYGVPVSVVPVLVAVHVEPVVRVTVVPVLVGVHIVPVVRVPVPYLLYLYP